jgi:hypothetical protein
VLIIPDRVLEILTEVSRKHQITVDALLGDASRWPERREAIHRVRNEAPAGQRPPSYGLLSKWFGRHETTIRHALGRWKKPGQGTRYRRTA